MTAPINPARRYKICTGCKTERHCTLFRKGAEVCRRCTDDKRRRYVLRPMGKSIRELEDEAVAREQAKADAWIAKVRAECGLPVTRDAVTDA